jgi:hypothetical protein
MNILNTARIQEIQNQLSEIGYLILERSSLWFNVPTLQKVKSVSRPLPFHARGPAPLQRRR